MNLQMYSIRDKKTEVYNTPFFQKTHGEAERNFKSLVNDSKSTISQFPDDYVLYHLGTYNDNLGTFTLLDGPMPLIEALSLKM